MKRLFLALFTAILLSGSSVWAQDLKISRETGILSPEIQAEAIQKFQHLSTAKTSGSACTDTVDFTFYKAPGLFTPGGTGGYYIWDPSTYPAGQFFLRDSITVTGVRVILGASKLGLPSTMVTGGTGVYTDGDTLSLTAKLYAIDTIAPGQAVMSSALATTQVKFVIDTTMGSQGVVVSGTWGYGTFPNPVDLSSYSQAFYMITLESNGGTSDSLYLFSNRTVTGYPPYERTSMITLGSGWNVLGNYAAGGTALTYDFCISPIVQHNLYTSFTTAQDTFIEGDTVRPTNTSHIAYRSEQYNLSVFAEKYQNSLALGNFLTFKNFRPQWVWMPGDTTFSYPDTAYTIYTTPGTGDTVTKNIELLNRIITFGMGGVGCPVGTPQTANKTVVIVDTSTTVGINPLTGNEFTVKAYPVPASDFLNVEIEELENASLSIFNLSGQKLLFREGVRGKIRINTKDFENGMYILYIESKGVTSQMKIQIKH